MTDSQIVSKFLKQVDKHNFSTHQNLIQKACTKALESHKDQLRKTGEPYIIHPIEIAHKLMLKYQDPDLVVAALLHDTIEDAEVRRKEIYNLFGEKVGFIVDSVTKTKNNYFNKPDILFGDKIEKLLYGGLQDIRCILLKITDREHNLITLRKLKKNKQIRMAFETQAIYLPLKRIIRYKEYDLSVNDHKDLLKYFLNKNNIQDPLQFKEKLYSKTFINFDNDTFNQVYNNASSIIWKINDKDMYMRLINSPTFDEKVEILSLQMTTDGQFTCTFKYKQGQIFDELDSKFEIQDSYFIL